VADDCLFCKIGAGSIPAPHVFDDELCFAINDIAPKAPTHILVVPREHFSGAPEVTDAREKAVGHLVRVAAQLARQKGLENGGYRLVFNSGPDAGQTVFHLHLHLLGGRPLGEMNGADPKSHLK
jgi:diadenosine tetraphosphate (Ap4A) HIT family hydrolase